MTEPNLTPPDTSTQTPISAYPAPYYPSLPAMGMPERYLDGMINNYGVKLGWMKSHVCACTYGYNIPGSPNPTCNTCHGRGFYWDEYCCTFTGLITFMHTASAPDEPGMLVDSKYGTAQRAEPTLTIPYSCQEVWQNSGEMDAFCEPNATTKFNSVLVQGETVILPYQQSVDVQNVYAYDPMTQTTSLLDPSQYTVTGAQVDLIGFEDGTAYTVEYFASPVYLAWRLSGGMAHNRPFANGTGQIPKRFRLVAMDIWTRSRNNGSASTSPQAI